MMGLAYLFVFLLLGSFLKRVVDIRVDQAPLRAQLAAERAENARLHAMIAAWNRKADMKNRIGFYQTRKDFTPNFWQDLGIAPTNDKRVVMRAFRQKAKTAHPDHGGSAYAFQKLFEAKNQALRECR